MYSSLPTLEFIQSTRGTFGLKTMVSKMAQENIQFITNLYLNQLIKITAKVIGGFFSIVNTGLDHMKIFN